MTRYQVCEARFNVNTRATTIKVVARDLSKGKAQAKAAEGNESVAELVQEEMVSYYVQPIVVYESHTRIRVSQ